MDPILTIVTPTTGRATLHNLIKSIDAQEIPITHILLWDSKREGEFLYPDSSTLKTKDPHSLDSDNRYSVVIPFATVQGMAYGSFLRSLGLMMATTPYVSFADSDVWYEKGHLKSMMNLVDNRGWAYCRRKVWANDTECIGIDNFESVGDSSDRKVPYEMVDNNCMIFNRRFGTSGAVLYREVNGQYNDDRLFYAFLKQHAGEPGVTKIASVNQVCPKRLEPMFREHCTKI